MGKDLSLPNHKKISISIVLFRNDIEELRCVIRCALNSNLVGILYLIDNSPTNDLNILKKIDEERIEYFFQNNNLGFGKAHNIGIQFANKKGYKYHLILNPDIEFGENTLENLFSYMESNINCGMVTPKIFYKNGDLQYLCKKLPTPVELFGKRLPLKLLRENLNKKIELHNFDYNSTMNIPYLSGCFMFCRMKSFEKVGLFDERYFMYMEDLDLTRRFHEKYETIFYPEVSITHGFRSESRKNIKLLFALIVSAIKYFNKYGWFFDKERKNVNKRLLESIIQVNL